MAFNFNGNTPKKLDLKFLTDLQNVLNVARVKCNGVTVWLQRILYTITGIPPLTANKSFGEPLEDYKIYGKTIQSKLPDGYTEVEYIASNKVIDLGIKTNQNMQIETKVKRVGYGGYVYVSDGDSSGSSNTSAYIGSSASGGSGTWRFGNKSASVRLSTTAFQETIQNKEGVWVDNIKDGSYSNVPDFVSTSNLRAFSNVSNPVCAIAYIKIKNYGENTYTHIWIPCKRNSDNVYGFYDIIGKQFYTNAVATIEAGSEVVPTPTSANPIEIKSVGDLITDSIDVNYGKYKIHILVNAGQTTTTTNIYLDEPLRKAIFLPNEYQEVEYLESTREQYINTGVIPSIDKTYNFKTEINYTYFDESIAYEIWVISTRRPQRFQPIGAYHQQSVGGYGSSWTYNSSKLSANTWYSYDVTISNGSQDFNGTSTSFSTTGDFSNIFLFASNGSSKISEGTPVLFANIKMKKVIITEDNNIIRHFVPCYRKSDNKPGMYDLATNTFYTNDGTGDDFTVGPAINGIDYIDYANSKRVTNVEVIDNTGTLPIEQSLRGLATPIEETIELPEILTQEGTNIISIGTEVQPSNMEVQYYGTKF